MDCQPAALPQLRRHAVWYKARLPVFALLDTATSTKLLQGPHKWTECMRNPAWRAMQDHAGNGKAAPTLFRASAEHPCR